MVNDKITNQKKCEHCSKWTDGDKAFCSYCGEILDLNYRKQIDELAKNESVLMNYYKIKNSDSNFLLWLIEKLIQGGQIIVMAIIALVTFVLVLLPT
ncbi:MAG: hypothetical protein V4620_06215 [Bacteroidota bacterium]